MKVIEHISWAESSRVGLDRAKRSNFIKYFVENFERATTCPHASTFWKFQPNLYGCFRFGNCIYHQVYLFRFFSFNQCTTCLMLFIYFFKWPNAKLFPFLDRNVHNHIKEVSRWMRVDSCFQPCSNTCNVNINDFPQHVLVSCGISCSRDWESIRKVLFNLNKVHTNNTEIKFQQKSKKRISFSLIIISRIKYGWRFIHWLMQQISRLFKYVRKAAKANLLIATAAKLLLRNVIQDPFNLLSSAWQQIFA